jgi:hypothetical protein
MRWDVSANRTLPYHCHCCLQKRGRGFNATVNQETAAAFLVSGNIKSQTQPGLTPLPPQRYLPPSPTAISSPHYPLAMAALIYIELVNSLNCPKCGYNNMTGKETCEGTLADGSTCGARLATTA